jgi:hypothetical protein
MVKRTCPEFATETEWTLLKKSRLDDESPIFLPTTLMPRLPSSRRQGLQTDDIFRERPDQSIDCYPSLKSAVTLDEDTDPRTEHGSDTQAFPSPPRATLLHQLSLRMRPNPSSNPFLLPSSDGKAAQLSWRLSRRQVAAEAFNGEGSGFVTPKLSPATTSPMSPPSIPRMSNESEEDISPNVVPPDLFFPILS